MASQNSKSSNSSSSSINAHPSAKRRRVEAANETLKKPFRSPMVNRQQKQVTPTTATGISSSSSTTTPNQNSPNINRPRNNCANSSTKPPPPPPPSKIPITPLRSRQIPPSPLTISSSSSSSTPSTNPLINRVQSTPVPARYNESAPVPSSTGDDDHLLSRIQAAQRQMNAHVRALQAELDLIRQARRIEDASRKKRPGEEIDAELKELVTKWKGASRAAAEELFELVKGRVENMGGGEAWRRSRRGNGGWGCDDGDENGRGVKRRRNDDDDEGDGEVEDEEGGEEDDKGEEGEEEGFTMLMMLKSLNIEPEVLGWDAAEEKWKD